MNEPLSTKSPFDIWLAEISAQANPENAVWDPGFDSGRQLVVAKLGPYQKSFVRPALFAPKFYHKSYPLPIDEWRINSQIKLYGDHCVIDAIVTLRYQANIKYAQANVDVLPTINQAIKTRCEGLLRDIIDQELRKLLDGVWIEQGLSPIERRIEQHINESLMLQHIQCRALCELLTTVKEIEDGETLENHVAQEDIFLKILKKNFETKERRAQERIRQELVLEEKRLERQQRMIDQYNQEQALHRIEQEQNALNLKRRLEEQERQLNEQFTIEERLHRERVYHEQNLKLLAEDVTAKSQKEILAKQLESEHEILQQKLVHEKRLKDTRLAAEIAEFEKDQALWNEVHERLRIEKIEQEKRLKQLENEAELALMDTKQSEEQQLQERLLREKLIHEARLKDLELEMQISEHEKRFSATQQLDNYLRRDIELLILEKHREDLLHEIKKSKQDETLAISGLDNS